MSKRYIIISWEEHGHFFQQMDTLFLPLIHFPSYLFSLIPFQSPCHTPYLNIVIHLFLPDNFSVIHYFAKLFSDKFRFHKVLIPFLKQIMVHPLLVKYGEQISEKIELVVSITKRDRDLEQQRCQLEKITHALFCRNIGNNIFF